MHGAYYSGWYELAGQFPPTLDTENDPTLLKPFESPACYGVDSQRGGRLATGSCPTGTARSVVQKSVGGYTWDWIYHRLWRSSSATLFWGGPEYDDLVLEHEMGKLTTDANIVTFLPAFGRDLILITATGSHVLSEAIDQRGTFAIQTFRQDFSTGTAAYANVFGDVPFLTNSKGLFSYDGKNVKEWTRPIRAAPGSFANVAITSDFDRGLVIGTSKFALDVATGKLFDYGTAGFLFTSRTLAAAPTFEPFEVERIALCVEGSTNVAGTLTWQSKIEDNDWFSESAIELKWEEDRKTRVEFPIENPHRTGHKFAIRLTSMPSNLYIRSILVVVANYAVEAGGE